MAVQISTRTNFTSVMGTNTHMKLKNGVNMTLKMSVYRQGISMYRYYIIYQYMFVPLFHNYSEIIKQQYIIAATKY